MRKPAPATTDKREIRSIPVTEFRLETGEDGKQYFTGYAATFNTPTTILASNGIKFREVLRPGAFKRAVSEQQDVRHLMNHDASKVLGRTKSKTTTIVEDSKGLHFRTLVGTRSYDNDLVQSLDRGDIDECSFGFMVNGKAGQAWGKDPEDDKLQLRELLDVNLHDISIVTYPAYPNTSAGLDTRSLFPDGIPEQIEERLNATAADCGCECGPCKDGNCNQCSDEDCDDADCADCPMQNALDAEIQNNGDAKTKRVDGEDLTARDFIIATDPQNTSTWKLPWRFSTLEKIRTHLRDALARFNQMKGLTDDVKKSAKSKLHRLCKKYGIKVAEDTNSANKDVCACACTGCSAGNCADCSASNCAGNCQGCPVQATALIDKNKAILGSIAIRQLRPEPNEWQRHTALGVEVRATKQADGTLELMVYGNIGQTWWGDGITAAGMKKQMDDAGGHSKIRMRINSMGGDAFEAIAIHNLMRAQGKPVECCIDGLAASAASVIAMCGDSIVMGSNAMMMVHNAQTGAQGYAEDLRRTADVLDKVSASVCQTYADRTSNSMADCKALMDAETWMSAADCVSKGFATSLTEMPDQTDEDLRSLQNSPWALTYRNLPELYKPSKVEEASAIPPAPPPALPLDLEAEAQRAAEEWQRLQLRLRVAAAAATV